MTIRFQSWGQKILGSLTHVGPLLSFDGLEETERLGRGSARVSRREFDHFQESGQKAPHLAVAGPKVFEIMVVGRPDEDGDLSDGQGQLVLGNAGENGFTDASVGTF